MSPVPTTENLEIAEHVDINVLQHPTKFQAEIIINKKVTAI